jgi:hypothetical protein
LLSVGLTQRSQYQWFKFWQKDDIFEGGNKTKLDLARELIDEYRYLIGFDAVSYLLACFSSYGILEFIISTISHVPEDASRYLYDLKDDVSFLLN